MRLAILCLALLSLFGALLAVTQDAGAWPMLVAAALFVSGTLFERFHYRGSDEPGGDWQPTAERFLDERSGRPVTVWFNARTGARRYVETGDHE